MWVLSKSRLSDHHISLPQVLAPYDAEDARGLLKAAIRDPDPVVFLENEIMYGESFPVDDRIMSKDFTLPIGKAKVGISASHKLLLFQPWCKVCHYRNCMLFWVCTGQLNGSACGSLRVS